MRDKSFIIKHNPELFRDRLETKQFEKLKEFIQEFLPKTGEKRKNSSNEIKFIHKTIDKIFLDFCGYGIHDQDLIEAFIELGYSFYTIVKEDLSEYKIKSEGAFQQHVYDEYRTKRVDFNIKVGWSFHIDISAKTSKELSKSSYIVPLLNGNIEKTVEPRIEIKERLNLFFTGSKDLTIKDLITKKYLNSEND